MLPTLPENEKKQTLFSRDFILLFCMAMCNNSYMAVFYCFEQWLEGLQVSPNWRGILLSALFAMVLLWRPLASIVLLSRSKLPALLVTICLSSCIMLAYPFIHGPDSIWLILGLRIAQGISLAVYSSCVVAVLVSCIPKGQSARGFAIFSLTTLLPYSIIPAVGEQILPLLGGEPRLFALMAVLAIPALCMLVPLAPKLRKPEISADTAKNQMTPRAILYSMTHSGLGCIYLACLSFSIMTALAIYFMKGLCVTTGATPAMFFMGYTTTIILVRLFGGHVLDTLPRYRIVPLCAVALAISMTGLAWGPLWAFLPLTILYGIGLGLLYPLSFAGGHHLRPLHGRHALHQLQRDDAHLRCQRHAGPPAGRRRDPCRFRLPGRLHGGGLHGAVQRRLHGPRPPASGPLGPQGTAEALIPRRPACLPEGRRTSAFSRQNAENHPVERVVFYFAFKKGREASPRRAVRDGARACPAPQGRLCPACTSRAPLPSRPEPTPSEAPSFPAPGPPCPG